jgi:hypothetical protein
VWPEVYTIFGALFNNRIQSYEYTVRGEGECLFRIRREITTNYKSEKADMYHKITTSRKAMFYFY